MQQYARLVWMAVAFGAWPLYVMAKIPAFTPAPVKLNESEVVKQAALWDQLTASDHLTEKWKALEAFSQKATFPEYGEVEILKYSNQEIRARVIALYNKEFGKYPHGPDDYKKADPKTNPWMGAEPEYMMLLSSMAESTFSNEIYAYESNSPEPGVQPLNVLYLAVSNPNKTLNLILKSSIGYRKAVKDAEDTLYSPDVDYKSLMTLTESMQAIMYMADYSTTTVNLRRDEMRQYIRKYALHLSTPRRLSSDGRLYYYSSLDGNLRMAALDALIRVGTKADWDLVEEIARDAKPNVKEKAELFRRKILEK